MEKTTAERHPHGPGANPGGPGTGFGHGKLILLGEHAVVFGQPALAAGIPVGVRARATRGEGRIQIPSWNVDARAGDGTPVGTALERLLGRLGVGGLDFALEADIPPRAGLGSSAAMAVAIARAAASHPEVGTGNGGSGGSSADVLAAVHEAEAVFHGAPSGIDAAAAAYGGVGLFRKDEGWRRAPLHQRIKVCVGLTGKGRDTRAQVEAVGRLAARTPVARRLIESLGEVTVAGVTALEMGDIDGLGRLFDIAHGLLAGLRVSSPELDAMVHAARAAGAIGAKLTGAGGGGAVIALAPSHTDDVIARWQALGFDGFKTVVSNA
jgi:mevalonate kinase